ncbi:iron-sulfur cluster assembly scaffold protein [Escherichia coli]
MTTTRRTWQRHGGPPTYGDVMKLQIKVNDEGIIEDARFKTYRLRFCYHFQLLVTEWVEREVSRRSAGDQKHDIAEELELPPVKIHCSILAEDAIESRHCGL